LEMISGTDYLQARCPPSHPANTAGKLQNINTAHNIIHNMKKIITLIYKVDKMYLKASDNKQSVNVEFFKCSSNLFYSHFIWSCPAIRKTYHCGAAAITEI